MPRPTRTRGFPPQGILGRVDSGRRSCCRLVGVVLFVEDAQPRCVRPRRGVCAHAPIELVLYSILLL